MNAILRIHETRVHSGSAAVRRREDAMQSKEQIKYIRSQNKMNIALSTFHFAHYRLNFP